MNNNDIFFSLLRAGLWERALSLGAYGPLDYGELLRLGEEQSVLGLVTTGLEQVVDTQVAKKDVVPLLQRVIAVENRNSAMNEFVASLFKRLQDAGIQAVLVKGQGIAQCYARPQWRTPGDVDLLLDGADYERAKELLLPGAESVDTEFSYLKHIGIRIGDWDVELHGNQRTRLSRRIDRRLDIIQTAMFLRGDFRKWETGGVTVPLPPSDYDVVFVFCHILHHFFMEGIGLRQICDWCRLLWTFRDSLDVTMLEFRLRKMRLLSEWKAFAAYAVEYLGMPAEAMPLYDVSAYWSRKADRINDFVLEVGNFGHNRERGNQSGWPYLIRKSANFFSRFFDSLRHFPTFPLDAFKFSVHIVYSGLCAFVRREDRNKK